MFEIKTTLILGAGASVGYGYPLGDALIDRIINISRKNIEQINKGKPDVFLGKYNTNYLVTKLADMLTFYDPLSIDAFLSHYKNDKPFIDAVKIIIAEIITGSGEDHLFQRGANHDKELTHWYRFLWNSMVDGLTAEQLADEKVSLNFNIITFNYDASLEYFLYSRVNAGESFLTSEQKKSLLNKLSKSIHHVYGSFIQYQWTGGECPNDFLKHPSENLLITEFAALRSKNIHLINERASLDASLIRDWLDSAQQVIFLGFGFDDTNIGPKVLDLSNTLNPRLVNNNTDPFNDDNWYPIIKYTNVGDSKVINEKIKTIYPQNANSTVNGTHIRRGKLHIRTIKSIKKVYQAINEDFRINGP